MNLAQLAEVCTQAARNLLAREGRPVPAAVVLPLPDATTVTTLPGFPEDDVARYDLLARFAAERMVPANAPAWGFLAEATVESGEAAPVEVVVVAFGARLRPPQVTAAPLAGTQVGEFAEVEDLDPAAMPFLSPLRHAADTARPLQGGPGPLA